MEIPPALRSWLPKRVDTAQQHQPDTNYMTVVCRPNNETWEWQVDQPASTWYVAERDATVRPSPHYMMFVHPRGDMTILFEQQNDTVMAESATYDAEWVRFWRYLQTYKLYCQTMQQPIHDVSHPMARLAPYVPQIIHRGRKFRDVVRVPNARRQCMKQIMLHVNSSVLLDNLADVYMLELPIDAVDAMDCSLSSANERKMRQDNVLLLGYVLISTSHNRVTVEIMESCHAEIDCRVHMMQLLEAKFTRPVALAALTTDLAYYTKHFALVLRSCIQCAGLRFYDFGCARVEGFAVIYNKLYLLN